MTVYKQFLVTDISGSPVLGATGFSTYYWNNGANITGSVNTVTEITSGWYNVAVTLEPAGELLLMLKHPTAQIAPDAHTWTQTSYDTDDIYGKLIVGTSLPVIPSQRYTFYTLYAKDNDDIVEIVQVPTIFRPLTSWTNLTVQAYPNARTVTPSTAPLSGTYSCVVLSPTDGTLTVKIEKSVINNLVPAGVTSVPIYADIQGTDPSGYRKTLVQLNITVNRDYNSNT